MSKKKLILDSQDCKVGSYILGIVSSTPHLEFVHFLNKDNIFNFKRDEDIEFKDNDETLFFVNFSYEDSENENNFKVFKNRGNSGLIGKELKGLDYILLIVSENEECYHDSKNFLNTQKFIQALFPLNAAKLKEKTKIILGI